MDYRPINFGQKFGLLSEQWQPRVIAELNDYQFKVVVKLQGDFVWHSHKDTDEAFVVIEGELRIDFRDGAVRLSAGEMFVVPKGVEHKPSADARGAGCCSIEPRGVPNTGDQGGERTASERRLDLIGLQVEDAEARMIGRALARRRPMELALRRRDRQIVDARRSAVASARARRTPSSRCRRSGTSCRHRRAIRRRSAPRCGCRRRPTAP